MSVEVYYFSSPSCGPCKVIKPTIELLKEEYPDAIWKSVNIQNDPEDYAVKYEIKVVPTVVVVCFDSINNKISETRHSGTQVNIYFKMMRDANKLIQLK